MPRLNFSIDDRYNATPIARPARDTGLVRRSRSGTRQRAAFRDPLVIKLALAVLVVAASVAVLATIGPYHFLP